jgi:hypothetical protein
MNERIRELNLQAMSIVMNGSDPDGDVERMYIPSEFTKKFAELIVRECINTLEFHGFDDAVPYVKWMATNKLGVKE